jgi:hypothetical protein
MCFDDNDFGGYDDNYDADDDIYAGTAAGDDGSEQDLDEPVGMGDVDGEVVSDMDTAPTEVDDLDAITDVMDRHPWEEHHPLEDC